MTNDTQAHQTALEAAWYALMAANGRMGRLMEARAEHARTASAIALGRHDMTPEAAQETLAALETKAATELAAFDTAATAPVAAIQAEKEARDDD